METNPALHELHEVRDQVKKSLWLIQLKKTNYRLHRSTYKEEKETYGRIYQLGTYERHILVDIHGVIYSIKVCFLN
jgi:hypothetical protein